MAQAASMVALQARPVASGSRIAVTRQNRDGALSFVLIDAVSLTVKIETPNRRSFNLAIDQAQAEIDAAARQQSDDELSRLIADSDATVGGSGVVAQ